MQTMTGDGAQWRTAYIALGANLGDRVAAIRKAVDALRATAKVRVTAVAPVIETVPVGPAGQGMYLNTVCAVETTLAPEALLACCLRIEKDLGRDRTQEERWGPRPIDLDLLLMETLTCRTPELELPHPRLHLRRFVLEPLCAIAPDVVHPLLCKTMRALFEALPVESS